MKFVSPRTTQWYQTLAPAPISTSPRTTAVGAIQALGSIRGRRPSKGRTPPALPVTPPPSKGEAEHQPEVLHRSP